MNMTFMYGSVHQTHRIHTPNHLNTPRNTALPVVAGIHLFYDIPKDSRFGRDGTELLGCIKSSFNGSRSINTSEEGGLALAEGSRSKGGA